MIELRKLQIIISLLKSEQYVAIEPRVNSPSLRSDKMNEMWLKPHITEQTNGNIELKNTTDKPILLKKHEQVGNVMPVEISELESTSVCTASISPHKEQVLSNTSDYLNITEFSDNLTPNMKEKLLALHKQHSSVFD